MYHDDQALIDGCIKKDMASWTIFLKKYTPLIDLAIQNRLRKIAPGRGLQESSDIKQNLLATLWEGAKFLKIRDRGDISYWLSAVAGNAASDHMRKVRARDGHIAVSFDDESSAYAVKALLDACLVSGGDSMGEAQEQKAAEALQGCLETLPAFERLILTLNIMHGKSHVEIAAITGRPVGTVSSIIKRSKDKIREELRDLLQES